jgi:hypothetical protein
MKLVSVREAERVTNKSRQYIYKLMKQQSIKTYESENGKQVDLIELLEFIERNGWKERWNREKQEKAKNDRK